jgi:hypothetical protein
VGISLVIKNAINWRIYYDAKNAGGDTTIGYAASPAATR